jgi:hypothetical protein
VPKGPRGRSIRSAVGFALGLALLGATAHADEGASSDEAPLWVLPSVPGEATPPPLTLRERVCDARQRLLLAERNRDAADAEFRRARRNDHPRGTPRQLLKEQRVRRRQQVADAEEDVAAVVDEASWAPLSWKLLEPCPEAALPAKADPATDPPTS